jgi:hypothetical protein
MEPGKGAFAFDKDLNITNTIVAAVSQIAVARDGSAVMWAEDGAKLDQIMRANVQPVSVNQPAVWAVDFPYLMNATPVIDSNNGWVYTLSWQKSMATGIGNIVMLKYSFADGSLLNAVDNKVPVLISQDFGTINTAIEPFGSFNVDGTLVYVPLIGFDANGVASSVVVACGTGVGGCQGNARRWQSPTFSTAVTTTLPFSSGNFIAAASDLEVYFLSVTDGSIQNIGGLRPLRPGGNLRVKALQPGHGADFYLLNGPEANGYPSEIIATDSPMSGELWRLDYGSGSTPLAGLFMAVDDANTAWVRIGSDSIQALSLADYRTARGATPMPR